MSRFSKDTPLAEYLDEPPADFPDATAGKPVPVPKIKGTVIMRCGNVRLYKGMGGKRFVCLYGQEVTVSHDRTAACRDFAGACWHQAECEDRI